LPRFREEYNNEAKYETFYYEFYNMCIAAYSNDPSNSLMRIAEAVNFLRLFFRYEAASPLKAPEAVEKFVAFLKSKA
jgi:hypothetical protein